MTKEGEEIPLSFVIVKNWRVNKFLNNWRGDSVKHKDLEKFVFIRIKVQKQCHKIL